MRCPKTSIGHLIVKNQHTGFKKKCVFCGKTFNKTWSELNA
jgi:hypothetical protein